jgi:hypothetical protein
LILVEQRDHRKPPARPHRMLTDHLSHRHPIPA